MSDKLLCSDCGMVIAGRTLAHAEGNLKRHKKSNIHKNQMKLKKELSKK